MDWNNINRDRDTSSLGPIEYDQTKVPAYIRKHANYVRTKTYGQEVREAQARNAEIAGLIASEAVDISNETKNRQDTVETQFNSVQQELTDKDPISAPEIIAARNGEPTLSDRLDKEHQEVTTQLAQTNYKPTGLNHRNNALFETNFSRKPLISFVIDDGGIEDIEVFKPLFDSYGWKFTMAIQTAYVGGLDKYGKQTMTWDQIKSMYNQGFTVASHTATHAKLGEISAVEIEKELKESRDVLLGKGFDVRHVMYPNGSNNKDTLDITRKYYLSGATIIPSVVDPLNIKPEYIPRISVLHTSMENMKYQVDRCLANNWWGTFYMHGYEATEHPGFIEKLKELMEYIKSNNVEVVPYDDGYDMFIRKKPILKGDVQPHATFVRKTNYDFPVTNPTETIQNLAFELTDANTDMFELLADGTFRINSSGIFMINYNLLANLENGSYLTATLFNKYNYIDGTYSTARRKQTNFISGAEFPIVGNNLKKTQTLSGQVVLFFPDNVKSVDITLQFVMQNQSTTKTNSIVSFEDTSHITFDKLGF